MRPSTSAEMDDLAELFQTKVAVTPQKKKKNKPTNCSKKARASSAKKVRVAGDDEDVKENLGKAPVRRSPRRN